MTQEQVELARHALGFPNRKKQSYRNHFVCGPGHGDYGNWQAMVEAGYARRRKGSVLSGGDDVFWLTQAGAHNALKKSERLDLDDFPSAASTLSRQTPKVSQP